MSLPEPENPYIAGNPVGSTNAFVGRDDILRKVVKMLNSSSQNALVLYGQRRIGKTSLLQHLEQHLPKGGAFKPILSDFMSKANYPLGKLLGELAEDIAKALNLPSPKLGNKPEIKFRDSWLPGVLDRIEKNASVVLLFDEFDKFTDPEDETPLSTFFPYLNRLINLDQKKLKVVFAVGRNIYDLSSLELSLFKNIRREKVTLLAEGDTKRLIRLSEKNKTLYWSKKSVNLVFNLTSGHPFLTQALCYQVWESLYESDTNAPPNVEENDVNNAIAVTLDTSGHMLQWLWGGLEPPQKIVASALAENGRDPVNEEELEKVLRKSGVQNYRIGELQEAPKLLEDWDLIEPVKDKGYRFKVELLRQWLVDYQPLQKVQDEVLDQIKPRAEDYYRIVTCPPKPDPSRMLQIRQKETGNAKKTTIYNRTDH